MCSSLVLRFFCFIPDRPRNPRARSPVISQGTPSAEVLPEWHPEFLRFRRRWCGSGSRSYIFRKAGFASADFLHVGADVAAGFDSHVSFQHAVDLVVDEYVANLAAGVYDGA